MIPQPSANAQLTGPDISKVGISPGDTFTFTLLYFNATEEDIYTLGNFGDGVDEVIIVEGENFTFRISEIRQPDTESENKKIITYIDNGTKEVKDSFEFSMGDFFTFTDWEFWEKEIAENPETIWETISTTAEVIVTIENLEDIFVFEISIEDEDLKMYIKSHYEKKTGVTLYAVVDVRLIDSVGSDFYGGVSLVRVGYNYHDFSYTPIENTIKTDVTTGKGDNTDPDFNQTTTDESESTTPEASIILPGFRMYLTFGSLIVFVILMKRRK
ncbi:MAG: hypothetical protein ACXAC2_07805 [Candidatus Kariarchaeaceae archaeon]